MYLIDENDLNGISKHVKDSDLTAAIDNITYQFVENKLLNIDLYNVFLQHKEDDTELTPKQEYLFKLIKRYMVHLVKYDLMYNNLFDLTAKGNTTEVNTATTELVNLRRNKEYADAAVVKEDIIKYLNNNLEAFPEYLPEVKISKGNSPIVFGNETKKWYGV